MAITKHQKFQYKIQRERFRAQRGAARRDAINDLPACPGIYAGFEEPPHVPHTAGGSLDPASLEQRLRDSDRVAYASWARTQSAETASPIGSQASRRGRQNGSR
jgi:hypothetical protein